MLSKSQKVSALLVASGLWLIAAFASDVAPDWLRILLFLGGFFLVLVGVGARALLALPKGWLKQHIIWRFKKTHPDPLPDLKPMLYVGEANVSANHLAGDNWLEVSFRVFNGSRSRVGVRGLEGTITCSIIEGSSIPAENTFELPTPSILRDRSPTYDIAPLTEFLIVLQQHVGLQLASRIQTAIDGDGVQFYFDNLRITLETVERPIRFAELSHSSGVSLRQLTGAFPRRSVRLSVNSTVSAVALGQT